MYEQTNVTADEVQSETTSLPRVETNGPGTASTLEASVGDVFQALLVATIGLSAISRKRERTDRVLVPEVRVSDIEAVAREGYRRSLQTVASLSRTASVFAERASRFTRRVERIATERLDADAER